MSVYKRDDSPSWWVAVCIQGKPPVRMSTNTTDKREAMRIERRVRRELEEGTFNRVTRSRLTLREGFDLALSTHWVNAKAHHSVESVARVICSILGDGLPLDEVNSQQVTKLKVGMKARGAASGTINRKAAALRKLLNVARTEWNMELPAVHFEKEKESRGRLRWLTDAEEHTLLSLVSGSPTHAQYAPLFAFLVDTGCRFSEAQRLPDRCIVRTPIWSIRLEDTKNGDARVVPLTARATQLLTERATLQPWGHLHLDGAERAWSWVREEMGLKHDAEFVMHALRHTFASRLVQRGVRIEVVSKLLGHRTIQQTMIYAHLAAHNYQDAINVLNAVRVGDREVTCSDACGGAMEATVSH